MNKLKRAVFSLLLVSIAFLPLSADMQAEPAYVESVDAAHWSAYIPIVGIIGAAIFFGVADESSSDSCKSYAEMSSRSKSYSHRGCSSYSYSHSHY